MLYFVCLCVCANGVGEKVPLRRSGDLTRARVAMPDGAHVAINYDTR